MLVPHELQETHATTNVGTGGDFDPGAPAELLAAEPRDATRSSRSRRRLVWSLAATTALVGVVALMAVTQSGQDATDPNRASDGSFEVAEANRMQRLRDMAPGS